MFEILPSGWALYAEAEYVLKNVDLSPPPLHIPCIHSAQCMLRNRFSPRTRSSLFRRGELWAWSRQTAPSEVDFKSCGGFPNTGTATVTWKKPRECRQESCKTLVCLLQALEGSSTTVELRSEILCRVQYITFISSEGFTDLLAWLSWSLNEPLSQPVS